MPIRLLLRLAALLLLPLAGAIAPQAAGAAPAKRDWSHSVTVMPSGAFLVGNPDAPDKLIEYFSYTCPHCADFAKESVPVLRGGPLASGKLSIEYRNFVRDPFDLTAALVARCGGAAKFLADHDAIYAGYGKWIEQVQSYANGKHDIPPGPNGDRSAQFIDIADGTGLTALAAKNGLSTQAVHQCLADKNALATILALTAGAWDVDRDFSGTPSFLLGGKVLTDVHSWDQLKPLLPALPASAN